MTSNSCKFCVADIAGSQPYIALRVDPIPAHKINTVINKLPPTIIVSQQLAGHVISYRQIAAEKLLARSTAFVNTSDISIENVNGSFMTPVYDAVLKYFPLIIDDPDINYTFVNLWNERKSIERKSRSKVWRARDAARVSSPCRHAPSSIVRPDEHKTDDFV